MPRQRANRRVMGRPANPKREVEVDRFVKLIKLYRGFQAYGYFVGFLTTVIVCCSFALAIPTVLAEISVLNASMIDVFFLRQLIRQMLRSGVLGLWTSVGMIAVVHLLHAKITVKIPTKRYQMVRQNLKFWILCQMCIVGYACTLFVQSVAALLNFPLDLLLACEEMKNESTPQFQHDCINMQNIFVIYSVSLVTMWEFFNKKMSDGYEIKFLNLDNNLFAHIKFSTLKTWTIPLMQSLRLFPICYITFRLPLQFILYMWRENNFVECCEKSVDFYLIAKTLMWCSVALNMFLYQWVCVNFMLIQRPNFPLKTEVPDSNTILLKEAISSTDPYMQAMGFFDLMSIAGIADPRLATMFNLSQPGNVPRDWITIINQSLESGIKMKRRYEEYILRNTAYEEIPVVPNRNVRVPKTIIGVLCSRIKTRLSWSFWMKEDPELELSNLLSDHIILSWIVDSINDTLTYAIYHDVGSIVYQDIHRITRFIIGTYMAVGKLGSVIRRVQYRISSANIERTSLSTKIETDYLKFHNSFKASMMQYSIIINELHRIICNYEE